jgi:hypothetical protein
MINSPKESLLGFAKQSLTLIEEAKVVETACIILFPQGMLLQAVPGLEQTSESDGVQGALSGDQNQFWIEGPQCLAHPVSITSASLRLHKSNEIR